MMHEKKTSRFLRHPITIIVFLCMIFWFIDSNPFVRETVTGNRILLLAGVLIGYILYYGTKIYQKTLTERQVLIGIFLIGFLIRGMLVLLSAYNSNQHDTHFFVAWGENQVGSGHFGYMQYLLEYKKLPDFDPRLSWSFYNPPLHHIVCALFIAGNRLLGLSYEVCAENLQILTLFWASMTIYVTYRIMQEFSLKGRALCLAFGVLALHPIFAILSLSLNNDCLATLFSATAILYAIRWYKNHRVKNLLCIAFTVGLGMMTKVSVGLIAPAIALVLLYVLIKERKEWKRLFAQFVGFGLVCIPLGLAWPIRQKILFDLPFNYVQPLNKVDMWQYVGNYSVWQRLKPSISSILQHPWYTGLPENQHQIWQEMFRTSLFDEWTFQLPQGNYISLAKMLVVLEIALGLVTTGLFLRILLKKGSMDGIMKGMCAVCYGSLLLFFVKFCFDYPYICTMNFRYIVITLLFPILGTGIWMNEEHKKHLGAAVVQVGQILFIMLSLAFLLSYCLLYGQSEIQTIMMPK